MKCGNCHGNHRTIEDVQACYRSKYTQDLTGHSEVKRTAPPSHVVAGPTQNQRNFLTQLLEQTGRMESDLSMSPDMMTFTDMSNAISELVTERKAQGKTNKGPANLPPNIRGEQVPQGTYTVVFSEREGDYITLRFMEPPTGKWVGTQLVSFLYGPDNDHDYRRCGNWKDSGYRVWVDFKLNTRVMNGIKHMVEAGADERIRAGEVYALKSNNCWRCGRTLTREDSITRGMGAKCARIVLG